MNGLGGTVSALALATTLASVPDQAALAAVRAATQAYGEASQTAEEVVAALNRAAAEDAAAAMAALSARPEPAAPAAPAETVSDAARPPEDAPDPAPAPVVAAAAPPPTPRERRDINPYDRDIPMTVPLNFNSRVLGELPVLLTRDDRFMVDSEGFTTLINPLLTPEAQAELAASLAGTTSFASEEINSAGISLDYDPEQLAVLVLRIDPAKRSVESLFQGGRPEEPGMAPERFSAYLNSNIVVQRRESTGDVTTPSVYLNGAVRFGNVVFETDVQGQENLFTGDYEVDRRYARFVYDQPEAYRRWFAGDLDPEIRGRQGFAELGGVGVLRQKQRFEPFRNNVLSGGRQFVLQESSTVRVFRNGVFVREFRLDPGQYDVSNLPLDVGSNDLQLEIQNDSGRIENINYRAYLDTIDLEPGDYDYGAYVGVVSELGIGSPDYGDGELAFTGFYRKAFLDRPAIGVGLQASADVQNVTGQTRFILPGGSRLQFDGSVSNADRGVGYAAAVSYDFLVDFGDKADSFTLLADYTSEDYATLGNAFGDNTTSLALSASYAHQFTNEWFANVSTSYRMSRSDFIDDSYAISATSNYRFTREWTLQVGAEYISYGAPDGFTNRDGFGVTAALVWQGAFGRRAEARYASARDSGSVRFQQASENRVGAFGYALASTYDDGAGSVSGQADYIANRFDASLSHTAFGRSFDDITEEQVTSLRIGSSIATTGGKVAIGRNIFDSFAIVYPHESLEDSPVIVGDNLQGVYQARSGALGPALAGRLTSYVNQSIRYDALDPPRGYNIGDGIARVRPAYKSGYAIQVGSAKFVSALGRLVGNADRPVALMSGRVRPVDDLTAEPELFFTNSVGRFAVQNLEPGKRYRVELFSSPVRGFEFTVPEDNEGLLDLQVVNVPLDVPED
ncbi:MAG: hypothetical protein DI552_09030 [Brevundimonas sp.]|uniref:hypothetical protein n=1 Tax=Brevundimonas sp. TaxID=1871086 RepID=UPI000DBC120C|nr:hypothetical protein [Brevundimonas sp.]PZU56735.1 MAG: hypothetical protein DI552_09030 [Brevundimonas sp.]